jgi:hypothetical protein
MNKKKKEPVAKKKVPTKKKVTKKKVTTKKKTTAKKVVAKKTTTKKKKKATVDPKRPAATTTTRNYLSKKELLGAVMESKRLGYMSDDLAFKLQLLASKYARSAQFARYTYNDDMQAYAMMMLVRTWNSFNPEKSDNPFAFFTQCIKNSFRQYLNLEKRQRNIRDELLVDQGLTPSYNYQMEYDGSAGDSEYSHAEYVRTEQDAEEETTE